MPPTNAPSSKDPSSTSPQTPSTATPQQLRPPLYNAEDYAQALKALFATTLQLPLNPPPPTSLILEHATTHSPLIPGQGLVDINAHKPEMGMKKFINGSELLFKLEADLRSAYPTFVQEFVSGDSDGVTCMLDALRSVHEALDHVQGLREQRKLVLDERSCVQCCALIMRNLDSIPKMLAYTHGLYPLVHCTVSTNTSTRVLALEILTTICEQGGSDAFAKVSEAISTLRLRLGEPVKCKVLVGAISSAAAGVFQATGIRFLRSMVACAPSPRYKVHLQVELEDAGLNLDVIKKSAELSPARESRLVLQEIEEWDRVCIDVDTVVRQNSQLRNSVATLQQEIATLKDKIKKQDNHSSPHHHQQPQHHHNSQPPQQPHHKYHKHARQQQHNRNLSSTPIQTITTPVDSEEEAEQIHQILEDLNNIVNNELLQESSATSGTSSEIVPVLNTSRPPLPLHHHNNNSVLPPRPVNSEPNLFESEGSSVTEPFRVKNVVQQLENSNVFSTLPNFNTGGLASKFANFKSSKLDSNWGSESNVLEPGRVKSLENLDNFTLKWKYPVVVDKGHGKGGGSSHHQHQQQQQPNSLLVLQDYRMNRFGGGGNGGSGSGSGKGKNNGSSGSSSGLFSKKKKGGSGGNQQVHSHPQKTFQLNLVKDKYNDLGGNGGGGASTTSNSPERVTDLPSGMY